MQTYHDTFIASTLLLLKLLSGSTKKSVSENSTKLMEAFLHKDIDVEKEGTIIKKVYLVLNENSNTLKAKDSSLFNLKKKDTQTNKIVKITIVPAIDIGASWTTLNDEQQQKIWNYLTLMYTASVRMVCSANSTNFDLEGFNELDTKTLMDEYWTEFPDTKNALLIKKEFDPFVGVGSNDENYGVDDIISGPELLADQTAPGIEGITKMLGIDKMINMEELSEQLKNLSPGDVENAAQSIKQMLGPNVDEGTSEMIDSMLNNITSELKNSPKSDKPIDGVLKIAETVAQTMMPKIDKNKVDMKKVWDQTKNMATNCRDKNGKPIFSEQNNPLAMLTGFMEKQMNMHENKQNNPNNSGGQTPSNNMTDEDYYKECQKMMKDMGMPSISKNDLKNMKIDEIMGAMPKQPKSTNLNSPSSTNSTSSKKPKTNSNSN